MKDMSPGLYSWPFFIIYVNNRRKVITDDEGNIFL